MALIPVHRILNELQENIYRKTFQINSLKEEVNILTIDDKLQNPKLLEKIKLIYNKFSLEIFNDLPNAFWNRKKHIISLPYEENFDEKNIPTKARPCQMNSDYLELCKNEIHNLLEKGLIKPSQSPWSCTVFMLIKFLSLQI